MATSKNKAKRNLKRKVERMSDGELQKFIRVTKPEIRRLSSMVYHAEQSLKKRGVTDDNLSDASQPASQE